LSASEPEATRGSRESERKTAVKTSSYEGPQMNSRERSIAALRLQKPDRVPLDGSFRGDVWSGLEQHFGTSDAEVIRRKLGLDFRHCIVGPGAEFAGRAAPSPWQIPDIGVGPSNLVRTRDNGWLEDEYGICRVPNSTGLYWHYAFHPLAQASLQEVQSYAFPDVRTPERYEQMGSDLTCWKSRFICSADVPNIFKTCWELRGFDRYMMDLVLAPRLVDTLAERALEHRLEQSKQLVRRGVDMIRITGDIAMQTGMMLSPKLWRRVFKPRLKTWIQEIRRGAEVYFAFHSDGNMEAVFADVVEIGFDAIHPIQPECMDVAEIKRRFGDQVCLQGTISCQQTLPHGTAEDVSREVRERIACCGQDGGLILGPSNVVQPDVPVDNILALYLTAQNLPLDAIEEKLPDPLPRVTRSMLS